jgi:hypothetical protein
VLTRHDWRNYAPPEGWSDDRPGYWIVRVTKTGDYNLVIDLPVLMTEQTLHVKCGSFAVQCPVAARWVETHGFDRVRLEAGDYHFEAYLEAAGARTGVKRVTVRSLPS